MRTLRFAAPEALVLAVLTLILCQSASGQSATAIFPGGLASQADMCVGAAVPASLTTLTSQVSNSATDFPVASSTGFVIGQCVRTEAELTRICSIPNSVTLRMCGRGAFGTGASQHSLGKSVGVYTDGAYFNTRSAEIEAIEALLGIQGGNFAKIAGTNTYTGYNNLLSGRFRYPEATFASPPIGPIVGQVFLFTDASATGVCGGTGTSKAQCRWSGSVYEAITGSGAGSGIGTLNGLTASSQVFANDTNITIVSNTGTHTITWVGSLAKGRQHANTVYNDQDNNYTGALTQNFSAISHVRLPVSSGYTPSLTGHFGYDSATNTYKGYTGSVKTFAFLDSNITGNAAGLTGKTIPGLGTAIATTTGTRVGGKCLEFDSNGDIVVAVSNLPCGSGGSGTNNATFNLDTATGSGSTSNYTLSATPITNSLLVFVNGQLMIPGALNDYTISGTVVTFNSASIPLSGTRILFSYPTSVSGTGGTQLSVNTKGDLQGYNTAPARLPVGADGYQLLADSAQALGLRWAPPATPLSVTSKGAIQTHNGVIPVQLTVGVDTYILTADASQSAGIKWAAPPISVSVNTKGALQTHNGTSPTQQLVGTNGQVLTADNTQTNGIKWATPTTGMTPPASGTGPLKYLGSNTTGLITADDIAQLALCIDATIGAISSYNCSTSVNFTPTTGSIILFFSGASNNTPTPALTVNGGIPRAITKRGGLALVVGDIQPVQGFLLMLGSTGTWQMLSPSRYVNLANSSETTGILPTSLGGTGTSSPAVTAGAGISVSGTWPNITITNTGATGGAATATYQLSDFGPSKTGALQLTFGSGCLSSSPCIYNNTQITNGPFVINIAANSHNGTVCVYMDSNNALSMGASTALLAADLSSVGGTVASTSSCPSNVFTLFTWTVSSNVLSSTGTFLASAYNYRPSLRVSGRGLQLTPNAVGGDLLTGVMTTNVPCVGTPGNTTGIFGDFCIDSTKAVWVCSTAIGCSVASQWTGMGGSSSTGATTGSQAFTTAGNGQTFNVPTGINRVFYQAWGASGGSFGGTITGTPQGGSGSPGGGYVEGWCTVTPGGTLNVNVGTGGSAGSVGAGAPGAGTSSSVGTCGVATGSSYSGINNGQIPGYDNALGVAGLFYFRSDEGVKKLTSLQGGGLGGFTYYTDRPDVGGLAGQSDTSGSAMPGRAGSPSLKGGGGGGMGATSYGSDQAAGPGGSSGYGGAGGAGGAAVGGNPTPCTPGAPPGGGSGGGAAVFGGSAGAGCAGARGAVILWW